MQAKGIDVEVAISLKKSRGTYGHHSKNSKTPHILGKTMEGKSDFL